MKLTKVKNTVCYTSTPPLHSMVLNIGTTLPLPLHSEVAFVGSFNYFQSKLLRLELQLFP